MLQIDELRLQLQGTAAPIAELKEAIGYAGMTEKVAELEQKAADPAFWNDLDGSQAVLAQTKQLKNRLEEFDRLKTQYEDAMTLLEIAEEEPDEAILSEIKGIYDHLLLLLEQMNLSTLLVGDYDANAAILTFHAGAGGTEAQDWAQMLYRMYTRWGEQHDFKVRVLDYLNCEEGGIKSASILIEGQNAYGFLKSESGVHRLVRISPFDTSGRRHTSFASLEVMPEIDDTVEVDIRDEDLKVDTYRSSGAGGQHVNKTESAIRITHIPSGVIVACQTQRSQHQNREVAMKMLRSKLVEIKEREHLDRIEDIKGVQKEIGWGSQIRSYVFMPYTLVKDHRTGFESGNISAVMDGELDPFIRAYLKAASLGTLETIG